MSLRPRNALLKVIPFKTELKLADNIGQDE